jgi:hypothetical protein
VPRGDRLLGLLLGVVLGIAIVAIFLFVFSEETIDDAELERPASQTERPAREAR